MLVPQLTSVYGQRSAGSASCYATALGLFTSYSLRKAWGLNSTLLFVNLFFDLVASTD